MSQSIENILTTPDQKKATEYNIITTMSTKANQGHDLLKNTILGGGNKKRDTKKRALLYKNQITTTGEEWEKNWATKRSHIS